MAIKQYQLSTDCIFNVHLNANHDIIFVLFCNKIDCKFHLLFFQKALIEIHQVLLGGNDNSKVKNHCSRQHARYRESTRMIFSCYGVTDNFPSISTARTVAIVNCICKIMCNQCAKVNFGKHFARLKILNIAR